MKSKRNKISIWTLLLAMAVLLLMVSCSDQAQEAVQEVAPTVAAAVEEVAPTVEAAVEEAVEQPAEEPAEEAMEEGSIWVLLPDSASSPRWETDDRRYFAEAFEAAGIDYEIVNAEGDARVQQTQAEQAITAGAKVILLVNLDSGSGSTIIAQSREAGVSVIDYDRLTIEGPGADVYVSFDNVAVGRTMGEVLEPLINAQEGTPQVVQLNGAPTDNNATLFREGYFSVAEPHYNDGSWELVADQAVPDWDGQEALVLFEQILTAAENNVTAVFAANDNLANSVISALKSAGIDPGDAGIPISGQDATVGGIQHIMAGDQAMSVYKPIKAEADAAAEAAIALFNGEDVAALAGGTTINNGTNDIPFIALTPVGVVKENIADTVIADGFRTWEELCVGEFEAYCAEVQEGGMAEETMEAKSIAEIAVEDGRFTTLVAALDAAGLVDTLSSEGEYTVFAPTDDAFAALPEGTVESLLEDPEGALTDILLYHVVGAVVPAETVVTLDSADTLQGEPVSISVVDGEVFLNDSAKVIITDIEASNGIVHVIDAVILPPSIAGAGEEAAMPEGPAVVSQDGCEYGGKIESIVALDDYTVAFNLCRPDPAFLAKAGFTVFGIQPSEHIEATGGGGDLLENPIGTGAYQLDSWNRGDSIIMSKFEDYWDEPAIADTLVFRWAPESASRILELQSGAADYVTNLAADDFATIEADPNLELVPLPAPNILYFGMTNTFEPYDNVDVRKAIGMGIDRQRIIDNFFPEGSEVASHFTPCSVPGGCEGEAWYEFDPEAARQMLADAGYPDGFETTIYYRDVFRDYLPEPGAVAVELQTQLADNLGITAEVVVMESGQFIDDSGNGRLDGIHLLGWTLDYPHPTNVLDYHFSAQQLQFGDPYPEIYEPLLEASASVDPAAANALYEQANNAIKELVPMVPIAHGAAAYAARAGLPGMNNPPFGSVIHRLIDPGKDTMVFVKNAEPISLYCADETDGESLDTCQQIVEALYRFDVDGNVEPALAEECSASDDGLVWTCALRQGVKFHDGSDFDAADVIATYGAGIDASNPNHVGNTGSWEYYATLWDGLMNESE
jgi:peptide/nickel transport system substrate-binding protein